MKEKIPRNNPTIGLTFREETGCGASFFTISFNWKDDVKLTEVFCGSSSKGGCSSNTKMVGRLVSGLLQHSVPTDYIIDQLDSEVCPTARYRAGHDPEFKKTGNHSCSKALASAMRKTLMAQKFFQEHQVELQDVFSGAMAVKKEVFKNTLDMVQEITQEVEKKEPCKECEEKKIPKRTEIGNFKEIEQAMINKGKCPECGNAIQFEEGCVKCRSCGFSRC